MPTTTLLFDLDDTLYLPTSGIWEAIGKRMEQYMIEKLSIPVDFAADERERLFHQHGTTMRGLVAEYQVDEVDFLDYVHDIPIEEYLSENQALRQTLVQYPQRKLIFTNANMGHAQRVLSALCIEDLFEKVIDIQSIKPWCKPQPEAFMLAFKLAGITDPLNCVMIDDAYRNLVTAHSLGMTTIQISTSLLQDPVDACIPCLENLPDVLPITTCEVDHV